MLIQIGGALFGLGLVIGFFSMLAFNFRLLGRRDTSQSEEIARTRYNRLLLVVVCFVALGSGLMIASKTFR